MGKYSLKEIEKMTGQKSVQVSTKSGASERRKTNIPADESQKLVETYQKSERRATNQQASGTTGRRRGNVSAAESQRILTREKNLKGGSARRESNTDARAMSTEGANVAPSSSAKIPYLRNNDPLQTATAINKERAESGRKKAVDSAIALVKNAFYEFPGAKQFARLVNKDSADALADEMAGVKEAHPMASAAGTAGGNMAASMMGAQFMNAIPFVGSLTGQAANTVANAVTGGKMSQAAVQEGAKHIQNVLSDAVLDLSMDTLPSMVKAASEGEDVGKVAAESTLQNLAYNAGGEMFGMALGALGNRKKGRIPELGRTSEKAAQAAESMGDASKATVSQADTVTRASGEELSPVNQQLQKNLETITAEAQRLQAQADDILNMADAPKKITSSLKSGLAKDSKFYTLDKEVSKLVRMYGNDSNLDDLDTFRKAIAEFEATGSSEAADTASMALDRIDKALQGKTYKQTDRLSKSGALKRKGQTYTYGQEYAGINDLVDDAQQQFEDVFNERGTFNAGNAAENVTEQAQNVQKNVIPSLKAPEREPTSEDLWRELSGETDFGAAGQGVRRNGEYVTQTATNTLTNSEIARNNPEVQSIIQDEINSGRMTFKTVHEDESIKAAQEAFKKDAAAETDRLMSSNWKQAQDFDGGMMLLKSAADSGDYDSVRAVARKIAEEGHDAGVRLQALEKYSRTPEGAIAKAQNILNAEIADWANTDKNGAKAAKELSDKIMEYVQNGMDSGNLAEGVSPVAGEDVLSSVKQIIRESKLSKSMTDQDAEEIAKLLTKGYSDQVESTVNAIMATQQYGISDDTIDKVIEIFDEANKYGENSKARVELENQAYALLANEVTTSNWQDKWDTWRYLSMLSKPATHERNVIGNVGMNVVSGVKNDLAAVMESAVSKVNPNVQRTKALLSPFSSSDRGLISAAAKDADDVAYRALSGSKYGATGGIKGQAKAFRNGPGKVIQKVADANSNLLDVEDWVGLKAKYSTSLAGYLKANNLGEEVFNATDDASQQFMNLAREYAIREAQRATFHESSTLADALSGMSTKLKDSGTARGKAVSMLIEGIVPFKKAPINIVKTAGRYSPIGIADAVQKGVRAVSKGTYSASEVIDSLASGLTGTGIMALGAYLGSQGLVRGAGSGDEKQDSFDKMRGAQDYSMQIGDKSYTIDWAAPSVLPLLVGVELQQSMSDGGIDSSDIINAIASMADPVVETTMMSGLSNALSAAQYAQDDTERFTMAATNAATGYLTQGIPSLMGSVARAVDNTRRTAYPENTGVMGQLERTALSTKNKIPLLSEQSPEYRDAWGRTAENLPGGDSLLGNLAYQIFSPGYISEDKSTPVDSYVQNLYDKTGNDTVLPQNISRSFKKDGTTVRMSGEDYSRAQEIAGNMSYEMADYMRQHQGDLTKSEQADLIDSLYGLSKDVAYYRVGDKPLSDNNMKLWRLYRDGGVSTLIPYLTMRQTADYNGNGQISQKEARAYLDNSDLSDVQKAYFWELINSSWKKNPYK